MICVHLQEGPLDIKCTALVVFITHGRKVKYIMTSFKYLRFLGSLKFRSGYSFKWSFSIGGKCHFSSLCNSVLASSQTKKQRCQ